MNPNTFVPSFYFYKLADAISSPYTSLMAYQAGNIDANGNIINSISSIDAFEYLVIKLKQIFDQLPYGTTKAKLNNYMATLQIFGEEVERYEITKEQFHCLVEGIISQNTNNEVSYLELLEDMATGGGAGAIGVPAEGGNINQGGVSGFDPRMGLPIMKRKKEQYFDDCEIFDVCPEEYTSFKNAKSWKEIPESETKNYLRRFQRRNKNAKIGVKGLNPLNGETELYWITYPAKNFMEDIDLGDLTFLFEDVDTSEVGRQKQKFGKQFHENFKKHLLSLTHSEGPNQGKQRFNEISAPKEIIRKNPELLKKFHDEMPDNSFYVGGSNEGFGHDAFVRVNKDLYSGFELKGLQDSDKKGKREITGVGFGPSNEGQIKRSRTAIERGIAAAAKRLRLSPEQISKIQRGLETFRDKTTTSGTKLSDIFQGIIPSKVVSGFAKSHARKLRRQREEIHLIGTPSNLEALSTADDTHTQQHTSTELKDKNKIIEKVPHPVYQRHEQLLKEIGIEVGGLVKSRISDRAPPRYKKGEPKKTVLSRFTYQLPDETKDKEAFEKSQRNAKKLWNG